jgi:hypothetical protein
MIGLLAASFSVGCLAGASALYLYQGLVLPGRQIHNLAYMQFWQAALEDAKDATGLYPGSLEEALDMWRERRDASGAMSWNPLQDNWGRPFEYTRVSDGYILASYGRDGHCDERDLLSYTSGSAFDKSPCYSADRDTVLTDRGFMKGCGK